MGFPRQEYWSELPFPLPGYLPNPGFELAPPALARDSLPLSFCVFFKSFRNLFKWGEVTQLCPILWNPMDCIYSPPGSCVHGILQAGILEWGCHVLLQGIFPTQGSNPGLPHCGQTLYPPSHQGRVLTKGGWGPVQAAHLTPPASAVGRLVGVWAEPTAVGPGAALPIREWKVCGPTNAPVDCRKALNSL